jgi:hypothetical protein
MLGAIDSELDDGTLGDGRAGQPRVRLDTIVEDGVFVYVSQGAPVITRLERGACAREEQSERHRGTRSSHSMIDARIEGSSLAPC